MLFNRGFAIHPVVFREFLWFCEGSVKVLRLLLVFISYFSILNSYVMVFRVYK